MTAVCLSEKGGEVTLLLSHWKVHYSTILHGTLPHKMHYKLLHDAALHTIPQYCTVHYPSIPPQYCTVQDPHTTALYTTSQYSTEHCSANYPTLPYRKMYHNTKLPAVHCRLHSLGHFYRQNIVPGQPAGVRKVHSVVASLAPMVEEISRQIQNIERGNPNVVIM